MCLIYCIKVFFFHKTKYKTAHIVLGNFVDCKLLHVPIILDLKCRASHFRRPRGVIIIYYYIVHTY